MVSIKVENTSDQASEEITRHVKKIYYKSNSEIILDLRRLKDPYKISISQRSETKEKSTRSVYKKLILLDLLTRKFRFE